MITSCQESPTWNEAPGRDVFEKVASAGTRGALAGAVNNGLEPLGNVAGNNGSVLTFTPPVGKGCGPGTKVAGVLNEAGSGAALITMAGLRVVGLPPPCQV